MKTIQYITLVTTLLTAAACYDDKDPVADITTPTGKGYYPVSANTFTDLVNGGSIATNRAYTPGTTIAFELQYWSDDAVKEINLYQTIGATAKEKIYTGPYTQVKAFSKMKSADTLVFHYTLPLVAATTTVKLDVEIVNENTLAITRSLTVQSKP